MTLDMQIAISLMVLAAVLAGGYVAIYWWIDRRRP
jgi:hypothetical protein